MAFGKMIDNDLVFRMITDQLIKFVISLYKISMNNFCFFGFVFRCEE